MQFLILAYDVMDKDAPARRAGARKAHLAFGQKYRSNMIFAAALQDDEGVTSGSVLIVDFPSRKAVDAWLAEEPYVIQNVWARVRVNACRPGPSFVHLLPRQDV